MNRTKNMFLATVFLLILVFIIGMLFGRWMSSSRVDEIEVFLKNNELDTESYLIEQEMIENFEQESCEIANARIASLGNDLWQIGKSLSPEDAEQKLGKDNYHFMKMKYHLMQIRTYILLYNLKQNCNNTGSVVLFYFSKSDEHSREQGEILDKVVEEYGISVFAVEYNYSKELSFMEEHYDIDETPALIIDYTDKFSGLTPYEDIKRLISR
jgi:hypothetical protein